MVKYLPYLNRHVHRTKSHLDSHSALRLLPVCLSLLNGLLPIQVERNLLLLFHQLLLANWVLPFATSCKFLNLSRAHLHFQDAYNYIP